MNKRSSLQKAFPRGNGHITTFAALYVPACSKHVMLNPWHLWAASPVGLRHSKNIWLPAFFSNSRSLRTSHAFLCFPFRDLTGKQLAFTNPCLWRTSDCKKKLLARQGNLPVSECQMALSVSFYESYTCAIMCHNMRQRKPSGQETPLFWNVAAEEPIEERGTELS